MTNFDLLYKNDKQALVDLLYCRDRYHTCKDCEFRKYGLCPTSNEFAEYDTVEWLAQKVPDAQKVCAPPLSTYKLGLF